MINQITFYHLETNETKENTHCTNHGGYQTFLPCFHVSNNLRQRLFISWWSQSEARNH